MRHFTEEQEKEIISFYLQPNSAKEVYRKYGVALNTLRRILKKYDISEHTRDVYTKAGQKYYKQTCLERYGVESSNQAEAIKEKIQATLVKNYGVTVPAKSEAIQQRMKATMLERYGVENSMQLEATKQKAKETCLARYGYENSSLVPEFKQRRKDTSMAKYGVECTLNSPEIRAKANSTLIKKYGTADLAVIMQLPEVINKKHQTSLERYGAEHYAQTPAARRNRRATYYTETECFDSLPELAVYIYAIDHNKNIKRNTTGFSYEYDNKTHHYFPDFEYEGSLLEIKGDHFFDENGVLCNPFDRTLDTFYAAKHKCMIDNNVIIWRSKDYQFAIDYFNSKYNKEDFKIKDKEGA